MATRPQSSRSSTRKPSLPASEVLIEVYDLLPPGRLSSTLWNLSLPIIHTSLHIPSLNLELSYGGHDEPNITGVYTTAPHTPPPGSHHRVTVSQGDTNKQPWEMTEIISEVCSHYLGTEYNVLHRNCNHFTNELSLRLTGKKLPNWCNRAAKVGVVMPCLVPQEWVEPPDVDTAEGRLMADEDGHSTALMVSAEGKKRGRKRRGSITSRRTASQSRPGSKAAVGLDLRDEEGRSLPLPERVPLPE